MVTVTELQAGEIFRELKRREVEKRMEVVRRKQIIKGIKDTDKKFQEGVDYASKKIKAKKLDKQFKVKRLLKKQPRSTVKLTVHSPLDKIEQPHGSFFTGVINDERNLFLR